ncbi:cysteine hydrolase family protein [Sansalvadorimonas verongulae]|uniref:cysteine hydrolase family protein n=1 Tax=Sansalvadorimonas verongulae TaxID=2172824 RepID=UPI0012BB683C|nr:cysteine hydrolase family protein [Sansalvadorimonas verongulae]MTI11734.1 cysteine hydrolase [Sansalvadorimonas verongulae]
MTQALLLIDIQNDYFADGKWSLHNMEASAGKAAQVLQHARENGQLVVHVRHENIDEGAPFFVPETKGAEIHSSVAPLEGEPVVLKNQVNSFLQTNLKELLDENGIETLTIVGSMSHMCVDAVVRAASDFGYKVTVVEDACATHDIEFAGRTVSAPDAHAAFMFALSFAYAEVKTTAEYLG